jgi:hypothetical protein
MMKQHLLLLLILFTFCIQSQTVISQGISMNEAKILATSFFKSKIGQTGNTRNITGIAQCVPVFSGEKKIFYMINFEDGGFVILSSDKRFYPILAYAFEGKFEMDKIPENCNSWLRGWESQIIGALENDNTLLADHTKAWANLTSQTHRLKDAKGVMPLSTGKWSQSAPHNQMCPADPESYEGHTPAGCVALAMSQLMYYYRFPLSGAGSVLYTPPYQFGVYGPQYVNFEEAVYNWPAMTDLCRENNEAIAQLCYHAGVSVETAYMPESSGASINSVSDAFTGHFNYLADDYLQRSETANTAAWTALLIENLENMQPVLYRSSMGWGGHVYLCDGYQDSTHFHFNWGWGGAYNGYFYIDNLAPGGIDINSGQGAIFNIYPDTTQFEFPDFDANNEVLTANVGSFEDGSANLKYLPGTQRSWLIQPDDNEITNILLEFTFVDTESTVDEIRIFDGVSAESPLLASVSGNNFPVSFNSSGSALYVSFNSDDQNQFQGFHANYYGYHLPFCDDIQVLTDPTGVLEDGSRYHPYTNNTNCEWLLAPEISPFDSIAQLTLHFYQLDLADGDTLFMYDGESALAPLLGKFVGGSLPGDIVTSGNKVFLNFITNSAATGQGWAVGWDYILPEYCRDTIFYTARIDTLSDGSGNKNYTENTDCYYVIEVTDTDDITITFTDFEVETDYDYLKIFHPSNANEPVDKFSGFELPQSKTYPGNQLLLHFHSDFRDNFQGWQLVYQASPSAIPELENGINIYPNPVSDYLIIDWQVKNNAKYYYRIYHPNGSMLQSGEAGSRPAHIDFNNYKPGIYYLFISFDQTYITKKIMKL